MVLEIATFIVTPGRELEYEKTLAEALPIIAASKGYQRHELHRCLEKRNQYVFLVYWKTLENHTIDFQKSPPYKEWKKMLHHFYEVPPEVRHYEMPEQFGSREADKA